MKENFTITIFTENATGLLTRISAIFVRRRITIEKLNVAASEVEGIHRFTIVINETEEVTRKLVLQIDKQVDVFKTFFHTNEELVWREHMLCKVGLASTGDDVAQLLDQHGARRISVKNGEAIYEVTGSCETTDAVVKLLEPYGITEIVKSAGIGIIKRNLAIHQKLMQVEALLLVLFISFIL